MPEGGGGVKICAKQMARVMAGVNAVKKGTVKENTAPNGVAAGGMLRHEANHMLLFTSSQRR